MLLVHTMVMFLTWLDNGKHRKGDPGQYLQWGMVTITFNISSNSSKLLGCYGDLNFHVNTIATRKDQPVSQDVVFSVVALGISQQVFPKELHVMDRVGVVLPPSSPC